MYCDHRQFNQEISLLKDGERKPELEAFAAVAGGNLADLKKLTEENTQSILHSLDKNGCSLVHWAALQGHLDILSYLHSCNVNLSSFSTSPPIQAPIHWAASRGHLEIVDFLIKSGEDKDLRDSKMNTPLIIAAQFNHSSLVVFLISKGADGNAKDKEGDTAIHWAAFKGHLEVLRLMLDFNIDPAQLDDFNQSPLHLACIKGHIPVVNELMKISAMKPMLKVIDKNGRTPYNLAENRSHQQLLSVLSRHDTSRNNRFYNLMIFLLGGGNEASFFPFYFLVINIFFISFPIYFIFIAPQTWNDMTEVHIVFLLIQCFAWFNYFKCMYGNPSFLPQESDEYFTIMKRTSSGAIDAKEAHSVLQTLCHTCHTVKVIRSKHCRICNRCVREYDHHCPYVLNCVALGTRKYFYGFLLGLVLCYAITWYLTYQVYHYYFWYTILYPLMFEYAFLGFGMCMLFLVSTWNMVSNMTSNERLNQHRYAHFSDPDGSFRNPFDKGIKYNVLWFFRLIDEPPVYKSAIDNV